MNPESVVPFLIAFLGGGGLAGALGVLIKARPEAGGLIVTAAQGAVIVQSGVIETLERRLTECERRAEEAEKRAEGAEAETAVLRTEIADLRRQLAARDYDLRRERDENDRLRTRIDVLETEVAELRGR